MNKIKKIKKIRTKIRTKIWTKIRMEWFWIKHQKEKMRKKENEQKRRLCPPMKKKAKKSPGNAPTKKLQSLSITERLVGKPI